MKKLTITPQKDTITICLPPEWVGKPLVCIFKELYEQEDAEIVTEVSEAAACYRSKRFRKTPTRVPRTDHRLRKRM